MGRLRYDVLYVADPQTLDGGERGQWYRFWPNGRAMLKVPFASEPASAAEAPTAANGDNFSPSISMFYSVVDDRITLESIAPRSNEALAGPSNRYVRETGRVNDDGSFTLTMRASAGDIWGWGEKHPEQITFRPIHVEPMQRQADW